MADTPSSILLLRLQSVGSNTNLWGGYLNAALQTLERASKGYQALAVTGDATIAWTNYTATNDGAVAFLKLTGSISSAAALTLPGFQHFVAVWNAAGQAVTIKCSGGAGVAIANGDRALLYCDGADYYNAAPTVFPTGITVAGKVAGMAPGTANTDGVNVAQMAAYVAAIVNAALTGSSGGFYQTFAYTATGGETSKSGADDNGNVLAYTPGAAWVYLNGALLVNGTDYLATTGTSVTSLAPLAPGDILVVLAIASFSVANALIASNNLFELTNAATARTNLGLGAASSPSFAGLAISSTAPTGAGITAMFGSPPAIGGTVAAAVTGTTITANTGFVTSAGKLSVGTSSTTRLVNFVDSAAADVPVVLTTNNGTNDFMQCYHAIFANQPTGQHATGFSVGKAWSAKNAAYLGFFYAGAGSNSNYASIGLHSQDDVLKCFGDATAAFKGGLAIISATGHGNAALNIKSVSTAQHVVLEQENVTTDGWGIRSYGGGGGNLEISRMTGTTTFTSRMMLTGAGVLTTTKDTSGSVEDAFILDAPNGYAVNTTQAALWRGGGGTTIARAGAHYNTDTYGYFHVRDIYGNGSGRTGISFSVKGTNGTPANYIEVQAGVASGAAALWATGSDTNVPFSFIQKGASSFDFWSHSGTNRQFSIPAGSAATNYAVAYGTVGGGAVFDSSANKTAVASAGTVIFSGVVKSAKGVLNINAYPTSSAGLATGDVWSNSNVLNIV